MAKKCKCEECVAGAPLWMVTFGDLMSLLLTFFVLLLSFSSIQDIEFQKAMGSLKGALGVLPKNQQIMSVINAKMPSFKNNQSVKQYKEMVEGLKEAVKKRKLDKNIELEYTQKGFLIRIDSPVLFRQGKAKLRAEAGPVLDKVIELTASEKNSIRVEGHTDNIPIHTQQFPSNWELSTSRALSVLRYFLKHSEVPPEHLSAVGYGEYHPLVDNLSAENRSRNRRVEIYVEPVNNDIDLSDSLSEFDSSAVKIEPEKESP